MTATPLDRDLTEGRPGRKAYRKPRLHIYGNIRDITQNVGVHGAADGAGVMMVNAKSLP
jgi:hypothetical protein